MNRTLNQTAALLGVKPREFRKKLKALGVLSRTGDLASKHRDKGYLYTDARSWFNKAIQTHSHYAVVMVKEAGVDWLAKQLGVQITPRNKDDAA